MERRQRRRLILALAFFLFSLVIETGVAVRIMSYLPERVELTVLENGRQQTYAFESEESMMEYQSGLAKDVQVVSVSKRFSATPAEEIPLALGRTFLFTNLPTLFFLILYAKGRWRTQREAMQ